MIKLHKAGEEHARKLIEHGKVSAKPFTFDKADRDELLGPKGTDVRTFALHHLGEHDQRAEGEPERYCYAFGKGGMVHSRALESIRKRAEEHGHDEIRSSVESLLATLEDGGGDTDHQAAGELGRSKAGRKESRRIVKEHGKWYVKSEDGEKNLGGPYDTEEEAKKRLAEVEFYKQKDEHSRPDGAEVRCLMTGLELRAAPAGSDSPGTVFGYAAVYNMLSEDLGGFRELIRPGAFADVVRTCDIRALANHCPNRLLGRLKAGTLRLKDTALGLADEIDLPNTQVGRDTAVSVGRGDMDGQSFSFAVEPEDVEWDWNTTPPTRIIHRFSKVFDVGPVTDPAYTDTTAAMRSMDRARPNPAGVAAKSLDRLWARQRLAEASLAPA